MNLAERYNKNPELQSFIVSESDYDDYRITPDSPVNAAFLKAELTHAVVQFVELSSFEFAGDMSFPISRTTQVFNLYSFIHQANEMFSSHWVHVRIAFMKSKDVQLTFCTVFDKDVCILCRPIASCEEWQQNYSTYVPDLIIDRNGDE